MEEDNLLTMFADINSQIRDLQRAYNNLTSSNIMINKRITKLQEEVNNNLYLKDNYENAG